MQLNGKLKVVLGHNGSSTHSFVCRVVQDSETIKSKSLSYGKLRTEQQAYDGIVKEAKALAKQYKCEYIHTDKKDLMVRTSGPVPNTKSSEKPQGESPLIAKFGNELAFKAMIKHAIKLHGFDKVIEVLSNGIAMAEGQQKEIAKQKSVISAATMKIARIIYDTRKEGIHMDSPSKEIEAAVQQLMDNDSKPKRHSKVEPNATYELNGKTWSGIGNAPAEFGAYINAHENNSIEDLRVR
jgi:DNA-binding protein H-NS